MASAGARGGHRLARGPRRRAPARRGPPVQGNLDPARCLGRRRPRRGGGPRGPRARRQRGRATCSISVTACCPTPTPAVLEAVVRSSTTRDWRECNDDGRPGDGLRHADAPATRSRRTTPGSATADPRRPNCWPISRALRRDRGHLAAGRAHRRPGGRRSRARSSGAPRPVRRAFGAKYEPPLIEDGAGAVERRRRSASIGLVLAPHYSSMSTASTSAGRGRGRRSPSRRRGVVGRPRFLELLAGRVTDALALVPADAATPPRSSSRPTRCPSGS